jgi:type I restriction enzyme S subunit
MVDLPRPWTPRGSEPSSGTPEDLDCYQLVTVGDLIINKMKAWQGSLGVSSPRHSEYGRFLHYFLRNRLLANVYPMMSNRMRPSQWRLEPERFADLVLFLPPLEEQIQLAAFLDRETARTLVAQVRDAIDRLKELRIALISAAVTGKIDVRGEAA